MTSDDVLVRELAVRMHRADHDEVDDPRGPGPDPAPVRVDLETYEAAHQASQWSDDEAPRARRRRTA